MRRMIENGFELTGPIERGDWETVERHLDGDPRRRAPSSSTPTSRSPRSPHAQTGVPRCPREDVPHDRRGARRARAAPRRHGRARADDGRAPRRAPRRSSPPPARECDTVVVSLFVNPAQFGEPADLDGYPRDEARDLGVAAEAGVDLVFAPARRGDVPARLPDLGRGDRARRDPRGRAPARPLPRRRDGLPQALHDRPPGRRLLRPEGRAAGRGAPAADRRPRPRARAACAADRARRRRPRALVAQRAPLAPTSAQRALALPRALATARPRDRAPRCSTPPASRSTTSRSRRSTHPSSPPPSASARPA